MKSIKFLAALAIPAMFAACTNEELVAVQDSVQQNKEFVGAELIGSDISINVGSGIESRLYGTVWSVTDQLGLGWVVSGNYGDAQDVTKHPTGPELFNNLMFYKESEEGNFTTKGNVYKGWYFAYYPYAYMEELGTQKTITMNPTQTENWDTDRYNTAFYLSGREFLSKEKLDEKTYQLKKDVQFAMYRATNTIGVTIKPSTDFTGNNILKNLAVKSIRIDADTYLFPGEKVKVRPEKLAEFQFDAEGKYDAGETEKKVKESLANGVMVSDYYYKNTTTEINNSAINLSGEQTLRIYTLPRQLSVDKKSVVFTINVAGGHFTVRYVPDATEEEDLNNNAVIEEFVAAYAENGKMTVVGGVLYDKEDDPFKLMLTTDMFDADYIISKPLTDEGMTEIEQWNACVELANALGEENPTFTLKEGANVVFTDEILAPANGVKVVGKGKLVVASDLTWNNDVVVERSEQNVSIEVEKDAELSVVDGTLAPYRLYNYGTIIADPTSTIGADSFNSLYSNNRIVVKYGAYVYPRNGHEGTIAYEVPQSYSITKINTLINGGSVGAANINTLIVNENTKLECVETTQGEGTPEDSDRYNPAEAKPGEVDTKTVKLTGINLEINGGIVSAPEDYTETAANVTMNGGSMTNINITGDVLVESGENTIDNAEIGENVIVKAGATLNLINSGIEGTLTNNGTASIEGTESININKLVNNSALTSNNDINVVNVELNPGSTTTLDDPEVEYYDKTIWYTDSYKFDNMTLNGTVKQYGAKVLMDAIKAAKDGDIIELNGDVELDESLSIDIEGTITIDLNGKAIKNNGFKNDNASESTKATPIFEVNNSKAVLIIDGEGVVDASNENAYSDNAVVVRAGKAIIKGGTFKNAYRATYPYGVPPLAYTLGAGVLEIEGGYFCAPTDGTTKVVNNVLINFYNSATGEIVITGGKYETFNPTKDDADSATFVNEPYQAVQIEGTDTTSDKTDDVWEVVKK